MCMCVHTQVCTCAGMVKTVTWSRLAGVVDRYVPHPVFSERVKPYCPTVPTVGNGLLTLLRLKDGPGYAPLLRELRKVNQVIFCVLNLR